MVVFGCLICKEAFHTDEHYRENGTQENNLIPVLTSCGHYFHLACIQRAFVHETANTPPNGTKRKSCPFSKCGKNLHNTSLIKIHPEEIHYDSSKKKIAELQSELRYWKNCVEKTVSFETGDKVTFNTGKANQTGIGTVKQIMVEIQLETGGSAGSANAELNTAAPWRDILSNKLMHSIHGTLHGNGNTSTLVLPKGRVKLAPSTSQQVQMQKSIPIPLETQPNGVRKPVNLEDSKIHKYPEIEEYSHLRPKWEAGDKIFMVNEKEYATIKWIGSRHYTFVVVIEFDNPVGDKGVQTDDLPFLIKEGFGRRLTITELNDKAQKVPNGSVSRIFAKIHQWGSQRIRSETPLRPTILEVPPTH